MERVQHRALNFVYNDLDMSYSQMPSRFNMLYLSLQSLRCMLVLVFKGYHKLELLYLYSLFEKTENVRCGRNERRLVNPNIAVIPRV